MTSKASPAPKSPVERASDSKGSALPPLARPLHAAVAAAINRRSQRTCDFHILVVGRAGTGKSTLAAKLKTCGATVLLPGPQDKRLTARGEPRVIIHDMPGFQTGKSEWDAVREIILTNTSAGGGGDATDPPVHAIWYVVDASTTRPFLAAEEKFFALARGKVPVIVAFSRFDGLVVQALSRSLGRGVNFAEAQKLKDDSAKEILTTEIQPLFQDAQPQYPPDGFVQLADMRSKDSSCANLIERTSVALKDDVPACLHLLSTQRVGAEACIYYALLTALSHYQGATRGEVPDLGPKKTEAKAKKNGRNPSNPPLALEDALIDNSWADFQPRPGVVRETLAWFPQAWDLPAKLSVKKQSLIARILAIFLGGGSETRSKQFTKNCKACTRALRQSWSPKSPPLNTHLRAASGHLEIVAAIVICARASFPTPPAPARDFAASFAEVCRTYMSSAPTSFGTRACSEIKTCVTSRFKPGFSYAPEAAKQPTTYETRRPDSVRELMDIILSEACSFPVTVSVAPQLAKKDKVSKVAGRPAAEGKNAKDKQRRKDTQTKSSGAPAQSSKAKGAAAQSGGDMKK